MNRRVRVGLCLVVLVAGSVQVAVAFSRSLIPYRIDGTVEGIGVVEDTKQRVRTVTIDGASWVVENHRFEQVEVGREVSKAPWTTTLWLDGRKPIRLLVADEVFQFAALTILATATTWMLTGRSNRPPRRVVEDGSKPRRH